MNRWSLCWGQHLHDQWRAVAASAHHDEPAFAQARVNVAFPRMLGAAQSMLERLDAVEEGQPYDIEIEMTHVTADIIFRTIFLQAHAGPDAHRIFEAFARYQSLAPKLMLPALFGLAG